MKDYHEQIAKQEQKSYGKWDEAKPEDFKHKKTSKAPVRPKCGMFLVAKPKNGYVEMFCGNVLEWCNYSEVVE